MGATPVFFQSMLTLLEWARGAGVPEVSGVCVQSDKFSGMMHRLSVDGFHDNYQHNTISDSKIKHCGGTDGIATILKSSGTPALRAHSSSGPGTVTGTKCEYISQIP